MDKRMVGLQSQSAREKSLAPAGNWTSAVQPVGRSYTSYSKLIMALRYAEFQKIMYTSTDNENAIKNVSNWTEVTDQSVSG
jgi:hypothetical protein